MSNPSEFSIEKLSLIQFLHFDTLPFMILPQAVTDPHGRIRGIFIEVIPVPKGPADIEAVEAHPGGLLLFNQALDISINGDPAEVRDAEDIGRLEFLLPWHNLPKEPIETCDRKSSSCFFCRPSDSTFIILCESE